MLAGCGFFVMYEAACKQGQAVGAKSYDQRRSCLQKSFAYRVQLVCLAIWSFGSHLPFVFVEVMMELLL
jgi:hypothetical protein